MCSLIELARAARNIASTANFRRGSRRLFTGPAAGRADGKRAAVPLPPEAKSGAAAGDDEGWTGAAKERAKFALLPAGAEVEIEVVEITKVRRIQKC
jgi:hypothetical protein